MTDIIVKGVLGSENVIVTGALTGEKGDTGTTGPEGAAATIAAGTATALSPGADPTVDNSGTSSAAVFDFGIPTGLTGPTGPPAVEFDTNPPTDTDVLWVDTDDPTNLFMPPGGTTNQALIKVDGTDFNTGWSTVNKTFVGLSNVDNTSDASKPVSTAQQTAIDAKVADAINDGTTTVAPSQNAVFDALALKAPLASPAFTGNPTAPTPSAGDNDTSIATTAFVNTRINTQRPTDVLLPIWEQVGDLHARPKYPSILVIGDSITDNSATDTDWTGTSGSRVSSFRGDGWLTRAMINLRQKASYSDVAISGQTSADGLARWDTDVLPRQPKIFIEAFGSNDMAFSRTAEACFADKSAMWKKAWNIGAKVITMNVPARNTFTQTQREELQKLNEMLRRYARTTPRDFVLCDWYSAFADPLNNSNYKSGYTTDGSHPNGTGAFGAMSVTSAAINTLLGGIEPLPVGEDNDLGNLVTDPFWTSGTAGTFTGNSSGVLASGRSSTSTATAAVCSLVSRTGTDGYGNWQQMAVTGTGTSSITFTTTAGITSGNIVQAMAEFETDSAGWADGDFNIALWCFGGGSLLNLGTSLTKGPDAVLIGRHSSGVFITPPIVVPTGTQTLSIVATKGNAGTFRIGRHSIRVLPQS